MGTRLRLEGVPDGGVQTTPLSGSDGSSNENNAGLSISERIFSTYYVLDIVRIQRKYKTNFSSHSSLQSNY